LSVLETPAHMPGVLSPIGIGLAAADLRLNASIDHARFGTGWSVDDRCGSVGLGELALMWARSSAGKSTWYLNVIRNTPEVPTLVVNMEMTPRRQVEWLVSMTYDMEVAGREIEEVLRWGSDDPRFFELVAALDQLQETYQHLHFVNPSRPAIADISVMLNDIEDSTGTRPVRVFVDHVGLLADAMDYRGYDKTISELHSLAQHDNISVIALQQVGRGGGEGGVRNDGHMPITLSSGVFTGEQHADWVFGLYRPDRNPKYKKDRYSFANPEDYWKMRSEYDGLRGQSILQLVKNRPFSELCEDGITLRFDPHTRRLEEF
jgi:hypothetical protein